MGQNFSRFDELLEGLGLQGYNNDNNNDGILEILLPKLNDLIDRNDLDDLYDILLEDYVVHDNVIDYDVDAPYIVIEIQECCCTTSNNNNTDENSNNYKVNVYQIRSETLDDAVIIVNGILYLLACCNTTTRTYSTTYYKSIYIRTDTLYGISDKLLVIDSNILRKFISRMKTNDDDDDDIIIKLHDIKLTAEVGALLALSTSFVSQSSKNNVKIELHNFELDDDGLAFGHCLYNNNNGPTKLHVSMTNPLLLTPSKMTFFTNICNALSNGNNATLKELYFDHYLTMEAFSSLVSMVKTNTSLITLSLKQIDVTNQKLFWQNLHKHPTLECLILDSRSASTTTSKEKKQRTEHIIDLLKHNSILKGIKLDNGQNLDQILDVELIQTEVQPRLIINQNLPRIRHINNEFNERVRCKLLGEFLLDIQKTNLSLIWLVVRDSPALVIEKLKQYNENNNENNNNENRIIKTTDEEPVYKKAKKDV